MLFDFDDFLIEPTRFSDINSRKEINPKYESGYYPIMTAPMDTVINTHNVHVFQKNSIIPILPRIANPDINYVSKEVFLSYSIDDFKRIFIDNDHDTEDYPFYALIDVANGHMNQLINLSKQAKEKYGDSLCLMVGNVASPETFLLYCLANVDYVRIGIGNGNGCLTTVQTGVGYPMASLISECYKIKIQAGQNNKTQIVADGGFKKYSDVIKALALGADYVMLGSILNKALESAGETRTEDGEIISQFDEDSLERFNVDIPLYKTFRGMSTKEVQKEWGKNDLVTSEGVVRKQRVEYTLKGWIQNFDSYLRSAMSYTGKKELHQFIGGVKVNLISKNAFRRFDK
jgi:IMP dehydrogenase/GMP reductase